MTPELAQLLRDWLAYWSSNGHSTGLKERTERALARYEPTDEDVERMEKERRMRTVNRPWWKGLNDIVPVIVFGIAITVDVAMWCHRIPSAVTLVPLIIAIDHALWNMSRYEDKLFDTGFGCGFRQWRKRR